MASREDLVREAEARLGASLKNKWRLEALLGLGGMAAVYRGVHRNNSRVAIKVLHAHLTGDRAVRTRFLREGYIANAIAHPAVVSILDDDVDGHHAFLVAELIEGRTLEQLRNEAGGRIAAAALLPICAELLDVLTVAHAGGVIHRDLKPDNLMIARDGALKVLDFGLARARDVRAHEADLTGPGTLLGTPHFVAPEQAAGRWKLVDAQSDLWAVGATLFRALTGRHVHDGDSAQEVLARAATEPAPSLREHFADAPEALVAFVDRALAFAKADRFENARAMREALDETARACNIVLGRRDDLADSSPAPVLREVVAARRVGWLPALLTTAAAVFVVSLFPRAAAEPGAVSATMTPAVSIDAVEPPPPRPTLSPPASSHTPRRIMHGRPVASSVASTIVPPPSANPLDRRK